MIPYRIQVSSLFIALFTSKNGKNDTNYFFSKPKDVAYFVWGITQQTGKRKGDTP